MKTLQNAMAALSMIADSSEPVAVAEIGKRLDLPRSSASRLMSSLRTGGLVEQDAKSRRYSPGPLAWRLGVGYHAVGYDAELIEQAMMSLTLATGFTSWMAVLNSANIVLLRQHQGQVPSQFTVRLGQSLPAHATAVGKALLSRLPDSAISALYDDRLPRETDHTIATPLALLTDIRNIRSKGYAASAQEAFPGVISVGGAIYGAVSNCAIGLSLSFPVGLGDPEVVAALLTDALRHVGRELGDHYWLGTVT
ncbi:IclR family transcriptional regulator [Sedimentitalea todarodis]|uniref:IclR family transcriptional regulator n=1 Tax=Sedimentitalea todarodis TaxID=1631240 RepID=A0ABU3VDY2_9RHOB|nr:IclR family transcriptional regulator [Sedimentitalea todarodis]MDU9004383.1 IclR family transcriptional regulator [Sedimentitalea todarodis]